MDFFKNIWVKRTASLLSLGYAAIMLWLIYTTAFYNIVYTNKTIFTLLYILLHAVVLVAMLYTRKQVATCVTVMFVLLFLLPLIFLNLGDWLLLIPPAFVGLTVFFACGASDTSKTILGTIFLLIYILAVLAYFMMINLFMPKIESTEITSGLSPKANYRYTVLDVKDNSTGKTEVYVEPNDRDKNWGFILFNATGYSHCVYRVRDHNIPKIEWKSGERLYINDELYEFQIKDTPEFVLPF